MAHGKCIDTSVVPHMRNELGLFPRIFETALLVMFKPFSPRRLLRLLGFLQWASRPASEIGIFLPALYHLTRRHRFPRFLPLPLWQPILQACILIALPAQIYSHPPPLTFPPFFVDAAPQTPLFRVGTNHDSRCVTSCLAPPWVSTQNQAEMYAVFHCLRQAGLRKHSYICVITDSTATFFALLSGRASANHPVFLRVLRRIWRIVHEFGLKVAVALVSSENNAADAPSRLHQLPLPLILHRCTRLSALERHFSHAHVIPRFWQRSH